MNLTDSTRSDDSDVDGVHQPFNSSHHPLFLLSPSIHRVDKWAGLSHTPGQCLIKFHINFTFNLIEQAFKDLECFRGFSVFAFLLEQSRKQMSTLRSPGKRGRQNYPLTGFA